MSQIYNGSFVLGDTSATTISGGPGIAVDEFTPGVIGIRTDETVLWSGNGANEAILSESMQNFSRLKIKLGNVNAADGAQYFEFPAIPGQIKNLCYYAGGGGNFYLVGLYCSATNTSITIIKEAAVVKPFGSTAVNGQDTTAAYSAALHEVIGVNRINGGV